MSVSFIDNSDEVLAAFEAAILMALERCGRQAEGYAIDLAPWDTGNLRNSITHEVDPAEPAVYVGTNTYYAIYQEMGTGIHAEGGGGRPTPWAYQDENGDWHWTKGNTAKPFIKPAVADHAQTYQNIIEDEMKNG